MRYCLILFFASALLGCQSKPKAEATTSAVAQEVVDAGCGHGDSCQHAEGEAPASLGKGATLYGKALSKTESIDFAGLMAQPDEYHGKTIRVSGHVRRACSRKGCWMELAESEKSDGPGCRVKFKDYGFFVPTDAAGASATLEGVVEVTQVKKEAVQHYESEGATFPNKGADGSAKEVRIVATGVELTRG